MNIMDEKDHTIFFALIMSLSNFKIQIYAEFVFHRY